MTPDELVQRAKSQLEGKNPEFPCIETCRAIIDLGRQRDTILAESKNVLKSKEYLTADYARLKEKAISLEKELEEERNKASKFKFLNAVAYDFIREVASGEHEDERDMARRMFDLHKDDLGIKLMRCHRVTSKTEADKRFSLWCKANGAVATPEKYVEWLLSVVD